MILNDYHRRSIIIVSLFLMQLFVASASNFTSATSNISDYTNALISNLQASKNFLSLINDNLILIIQFLFFGAIILFGIYLAVFKRFGLIKRESIIIYPFEVLNNEEKYNGKTIQTMLMAELKRIQYILDIYKIFFEGDRRPPQEKWIFSDDITIPQLGSIGMGNSSISIGELLTVVKNMLYCDDGQKIKGFIEKIDLNLKLIACISGNRKSNKEPKKNPDEFTATVECNIKDRSICDLTRDLAYVIYYHICREEINNPDDIYEDALYVTLNEFKNNNESMAAYKNYRETGEIDYLQLASNRCLEAARINPDAPRTIFLMEELAKEFIEKKKYKEAINLYEKIMLSSLMKDYPFAWNNLGEAYMQLGSQEKGKIESENNYLKAKDAFEKAISSYSKYKNIFKEKADKLKETGKSESKEASEAQKIANGEYDEWLNTFQTNKNNASKMISNASEADEA